MVRIISALILAVTASCAFAAEPLTLVDNPPDRHIVVKGDTLWDISGKFLKQPWRWPEIWRLNKEQIKNPHWIYPGDIILLDLSGADPRLTIAKPLNVKVDPMVHGKAVQQVIPSIPANVIEPFISQPLIIEDKQLNDAVRIAATAEDRMLVGSGDIFYATGIPDASIEKWQVFRPGKPIKDPVTRAVIAHEAFFLGHARLVKPGEPATLRVTQAKEEMARGDYLMPSPPPEIIAYVPRRPEQPISARVVSIYGGVNEGGANSVVALNVGKSNGVEVGHVVALFRNAVSSDFNPESGMRSKTQLPEERYGLAFVFRVFNNIAYGLVVESAKSVVIGDSARNP